MMSRPRTITCFLAFCALTFFATQASAQIPVQIPGINTGSAGTVGACTTGTCNESCAGGGCTYSCAAGTTCLAACSGGGCVHTCHEGATCTFACSGGGCVRTCEEGANCTLSCTGSGCSDSTATAAPADAGNPEPTSVASTGDRL